MALFGDAPATPPTPVTVDEERRRYALEYMLKVIERIPTTPPPSVADIVKGAGEVEAYLLPVPAPAVTP